MVKINLIEWDYVVGDYIFCNEHGIVATVEDLVRVLIELEADMAQVKTHYDDEGILNVGVPRFR